MEFHQTSYGGGDMAPPPPPPPVGTMDWGQPQFVRTGEQASIHQRQGGLTPPQQWAGAPQPPQHVTPPGANLPPTQDWGADFANTFSTTNALNAVNVATRIAQGQDGIAIAENILNAQKPGLKKYMSYFDGLKIYFRVTNSYVLSKLKIITFPFTTTHRRCETQQMSTTDYEYEAPDNDTNGMDLYIPSMALITYVLLSAAIMGTNQTFTPEVLGSQTSWCIAVCILEVLALYAFGLSTGVVKKMWFLDTLCMSGYKFVGICVSLLARFMLPFPFWVAPLLWFSVAAGFLLYSQLVEHFKDYNHGDGKLPIRSRPLMLAGVAQPFIFMFLVSNVIE